MIDQLHEDASYTQMDLHSLILLCIGNITRNNEDCTFERLVYECFTNFPKAFCLSRYPEWPDSNKLDRPLRTLRERGFVVGSPKLGFLLTEDGMHQAARVSRMLKHQVKLQPTTRVLKGKERNLVAYIKSSDLYKKFEHDRSGFSLDEHEFINLLRATLETPKRVLKQNLTQ